MTDQAPAPATSVAEDRGNSKRSINMKWFNHSDIQKRVIFTGKAEPLGQVVGQIFQVKERWFENKDGTKSLQLEAKGEFEAMNYGSGEVAESPTLSLPKYYLEAVVAMLERANEPVVFGVEIWLVPTGKNIPVAYEVRNLIRRRPDNPINAVKAEMAKAGRLRLPPPPKETPLIEHEQREVPALESAAEAEPAEPETGALPETPIEAAIAEKKGGKKAA